MLLAHLGRPKDREPKLSLRPVGRAAERAARRARSRSRPTLDDVPDGDVVMLENVRFETGETKNDPELAERYAALADVYVNDAFGAAHRAHASTEARRAPAAERRRAGCSSARSTTLQRHPRGPEAPARRGRRRREGDRQDRRARRVPRARRHGPDRRRDVLPVLQGAGPRRRRLAVRGGGHRAGAARCSATATKLRLPDRPRRWAASSPPTPSAASSTASTCPTAGWASTSAPSTRRGATPR